MYLQSPHPQALWQEENWFSSKLYRTATSWASLGKCLSLSGHNLLLSKMWLVFDFPASKEFCEGEMKGFEIPVAFPGVMCQEGQALSLLGIETVTHSFCGQPNC